jgi:S-sulfosulfanyl-L-cysteine sulfohydrolase
MTRRSRLTILQCNDTHGYLEEHPEVIWDGAEVRTKIMGGYARIQAVFHEARADHPGAVLALDNGDTLHGTFAAVHAKGRDLIPLLNALDFDAMTAHWDFAYGPDRLRQLASELRYPILAANATHKQSGAPAFPAFRVLERGGLRIGVIGIAAVVDKMMPPEHGEGLAFTFGEQELPVLIGRLRQQERVDLVVVLSHLGFPQDVKLASAVEGIDVLLSGHTHNRLYEPVRVNGAILIQSGCHGSFVGRLDLDVEAGKIAGCRHRLIPLDHTVQPDREMHAQVDAALAPHRQMLQTVVGNTDRLLHRATSLSAPMDDFLLAAVARAAETELAFSNGWRYGAPVPPGKVTMNDLWNIVPVNPPITTLEMTGDELWTMMEQNLESVFSPDPFKQMGGYVKRCFGVNLGVKIENPAGRRIQDCFVEGRLLDRSRRYRVASITAQSVPAKFGVGRTDLPVDAVGAMQDYLRNSPEPMFGSARTVVAV